MTNHIFKFPAPFSSKKKSKHFIIALTNEKQLKHANFDGKADQGLITYNKKGEVDKIFWGIEKNITQLNGAKLCDFLVTQLSSDILKASSFELKVPAKFKKLNWDSFCTGWGMAHYDAALYKNEGKTAKPKLLLPKDIDKKEITATLNATSFLKNLINTPPNILGTDELSAAAKKMAKEHGATIKIIKGEQLLKQNLPMIYEVGKASPRPPQLVDMKWGQGKNKKSDPKVTIVGKGIIYDTGGLNLKPGMYMRDMKKDMGGAAHALGVASMIMALKLPIQLRVILPIAENAVSGNSYRPGDVLQSRKGITVEINDTDAEGRLVVADALTYASEDKPDLMIDFCTLTGAARVALGYDIPAFFSNNDVFLDDLRHTSLEHDDPVWPLPLWKGYEKEMDSNIADLINDGTGRAGAIHGGLFLQRFIDPSIDWIHLDCFAWEQNGKAGRPKGGADTGMRAIFNFIKARYT